MRHNKTYTGLLETVRRSDWEDNLLMIYEHNLLAAAGHHDYTLRDNHIADLSLDEYIRAWVSVKCLVFFYIHNIGQRLVSTE